MFSFDLCDFFKKDKYVSDVFNMNTLLNLSEECDKCVPLLDKLIRLNQNKNYRMMFNFLCTFNFHRFFQSGMYFDYFYKKIAEIFVRNVFIYSAQFFGEKFMIEY